MPLTPGTRLGSYEVTGPIGAGGMGEVYRATDTNLKRAVAIKVLPAAVAEDPDRLARFKREAEVLASLNHSNIAAIYGFEKTADCTALIMELVEGEDLSQRIGRGAIPPAEAVPLAKQIAEALEAAHEQGIVHRDLKPANIRVRPDGTIKVLDFGLARAVAPSTAGAAADFMNSPTLTSPAMTAVGVILGTAAYMAPEQARGRAVDRRADIWAFGAVLFEMLSGHSPFAEATLTDTLAAIVARDPDWTALPAATPSSVHHLLRRCLEKDLTRRLQAIGEARIVLQEPLATPADASRPASSRLWRVLSWALAAAGLAAGLWWVLDARAPDDAAQAPPLHVDIMFPRHVEPLLVNESGMVLSPDGRTVAIIGATNMSRSLWVRRLDGDEIIQITEPALSSSAFSPDSTTVAVLSGRGLVSASLVDGERRVLTPTADITGRIAWAAGHLVFARAGSLWAVPETGGEPRALTALDASRGEILHGGQMAIPGTGIVLFVSSTGQPGSERIESVPLAGGPRTVILERATTPVWSPTGHLLFARDGAVLAMRFDRETTTLQGTARPVIPAGRVAESGSGSLALHVADDGTLAYQPRDSMDSRVLAVARNGAAVPLELPPARYHNPRLSPDGRRVLVETNGALLELLDLDRQSRTRLGEPAPGTQFATWSRDGRSVLVRRLNTLVWLSADGSSPGGLVAGAGPSDFPSGAGPDMESFLVTRVQPDTGGDVFLISTAGSVPRPLIATPGYEGGAQLSPDGRWLVYVSNVAGRSEILVRRYPSLDQPWLVSDGEGIQPRWSSDGREIFYRDGTSMVSVVFNGTRAEPIVGKAVRLFDDEYTAGMGITNANYDVMPDGRFLMLRRDSRGPALRVVLGWATDMARALDDR